MTSIRPFIAQDSIPLSQTVDRVCADTPWMSTRKFIPTNCWLHALRNDDCYFHSLIIAELNGEVIGWCRSFPTVCKIPLSSAELGIGLLKEYRNQGIGSELIARSLEWARMTGLGRINLTVSPENSVAIHVFKNCGFEPINAQDNKILMSFNLA